MSRPRVSAVVICCDEADRIGACLESVSWCDEVVVVDSGSRDGTVAIARAHATRVIERPWPGYVAQKNYALEQANGDWILCLDADERCSAALREAAQAAIASDPGLVAYRVRRRTFHLGRWIRHGGWYPDWKLRLVRRGRAHWGGRDPHDKLIPDGPAGRLDADLEHYSYRDYGDHLDTVRRFSAIVAAQWHEEGRRASWLQAIARPPIKFLECWVWKQGFRDGWPGFVIAATTAFYVFTKQVKLRELERRGHPAGEPQTPDTSEAPPAALAASPRSANLSASICNERRRTPWRGLTNGATRAMAFPPGAADRAAARCSQSDLLASPRRARS